MLASDGSGYPKLGIRVLEVFWNINGLSEEFFLPYLMIFCSGARQRPCCGNFKKLSNIWQKYIQKNGRKSSFKLRSSHFSGQFLDPGTLNPSFGYLEPSLMLAINLHYTAHCNNGTHLKLIIIGNCIARIIIKKPKRLFFMIAQRLMDDYSTILQIAESSRVF